MPFTKATSSGPVLGDSTIEEAIAALKSASPDARWKAARALAGVPTSGPHLAQALAVETDVGVREAIFTAIAHLATLDATLALLPYVRSEDASLRRGALDALRAMPKTKDSFQPLLVDSDSDVRILACELARSMAEPQARHLLCKLIETETEANVCAAAVEVLAEIGDASIVAVLSRCVARFPNDPFLGFAVNIAIDRVGGKAPGARE